MAKRDLYAVKHNSMLLVDGKRVRFTTRGPFVREGHELLSTHGDKFRKVHVEYETAVRRSPRGTETDVPEVLEPEGE